MQYCLETKHNKEIDKMLHPPLPQRVTSESLRTTVIALTAIAAKIYNALFLNRIKPKIEKILRKNQNGFERNRSTTSQILIIHRIIKEVRAKNLEATVLFVVHS